MCTSWNSLQGMLGITQQRKRMRWKEMTEMEMKRKTDGDRQKRKEGGGENAKYMYFVERKGWEKNGRSERKRKT